MLAYFAFLITNAVYLKWNFPIDIYWRNTISYFHKCCPTSWLFPAYLITYLTNQTSYRALRDVLQLQLLYILFIFFWINIIGSFLSFFQWSVMVLVGLLSSCYCKKAVYCSGWDKTEQNSIYGDALKDPENCRSRTGEAYPR